MTLIAPTLQAWFTDRLVSAEIAVDLSLEVVTSWTGHRGRSLQEVVDDEELRRTRNWSLARVEHTGSRYIHAGYPLV